MEQEVLQYFTALQMGDRQEQFQAYDQLMALLKDPVDWTYDVWENLVKDLSSPNPHDRSRAAQLLCALAAKSDPEERVLNDFDAIWTVTYDEKFVTARHSLQSIWKIGIAGKAQWELAVSHLANRYLKCKDEKNHTLIRFDIIESLRKLYDATGEERLKGLAKSLIDQEHDIKYRKKYANVWR